MKNIISSLFLLLVPLVLSGQLLKSTTALQGGSGSTSTLYVSHTIGQAFVGGTSSTTNNTVITGFEFINPPKSKNVSSEVQNISQMNVYVSPNPFVNFIHIEGDDLVLPIQFHVFDVLGRLILKKKIKTVEDYTIDVNHLSQSKYFVRLENNTQEFSAVIIKNNQ